MKKIKVLMVTECSIFPTGYSVYSKELLSRLHKDDRFEVAELACYISEGDERLRNIPWNVYVNKPKDSDPEINEYNSNPANEFGEFRFNSVVLLFQPDVVISIRDFWMDSFIQTSPLRDYYNIFMMPTVDAMPSNIEWLDTYGDADGIFTYSEFGRDVLLGQCPSIKYLDTASPAASENFYPIKDRAAHRESFGLDPDIYVVGTVMRNQRRKLYPDLFKSFRKFLDETGREDVYLYCHTGFPDISWSIPELIIKYDLSNRVLFTYKCKKCGKIECSFFHDAIKQCSHCGVLTSKMAGVSNGIEETELNEVYNLFDIYVQYASCLTPGQEIRTISGWKNIENIKIGDSVLTHTGTYEKVINALSRHAEEKVFNFRCWGDIETLEITGGHPILTISPNKILKNKSKRESIGQELTKGKDLKIDWVDSDKLVKGDIICYQVDKSIVDKNQLDLSTLLNDQYMFDDLIFKHRSSIIEHKLKIEIDNSFCEWIGLYVADGTVSSSSMATVIVTLHEDDLKSREICDKFMNNIGNVKYKKEERAKAYYLRVCNSIFSRYLIENCGKLENKRLPEFCENLPVEKQKEILYGLFCGDGHYTKTTNVSIYCTISKKLSEQISLLLQRIGIVYSLRIDKKTGNRKPQYRFELPGNIKNKEFSTKRNSSMSFYHKDYYCRVIKNIESADYNGNVYTLEVENSNSYVGKLCVKKNCEGFGMPVIEAAYCGNVVCAIDYSAMESTTTNIGGIKIPPMGHYLESETGCLRAVPDNDKFVSILKELTSKPKSELERMGNSIREKSLENYNWDSVAQKWIKAFLHNTVKKLDWDGPDRSVHHPNELPEIDNPVDQANYLFEGVLGQPEKIGNYMWRRLVRDLTYRTTCYNLNNGFYFNENHIQDKMKTMPFSFQDAYNQMAAVRNYYNIWEHHRLSLLK